MALQEDIFRLFLSIVGRVAACRAVQSSALNAMPNDPWGQPLTLVALQACSALLCAPLPMAWLANCKPMHGRYLWCVVAWAIWLGSKPGWPHWPFAPTFSRPFVAGSESKQAACRPCSHQEKWLRVNFNAPSRLISPQPVLPVEFWRRVRKRPE
jgi:hypothetical protein